MFSNPFLTHNMSSPPGSTSSSGKANRSSITPTTQPVDTQQATTTPISLAEEVSEAEQTLRCLLTSICGHEVPEKDEPKGFKWLFTNWGKGVLRSLSDLTCIKITRHVWEYCQLFRKDQLDEAGTEYLWDLLVDWRETRLPASEFTRNLAQFKLVNPKAKVHDLWGDRPESEFLEDFNSVDLELLEGGETAIDNDSPWEVTKANAALLKALDAAWEAAKTSDGRLAMDTLCPSSIPGCQQKAREQLCRRFEYLQRSSTAERNSKWFREAKGKLFDEIQDIYMSVFVTGFLEQGTMNLRNSEDLQTYVSSFQKLRMILYPWEGGYTFAERQLMRNEGMQAQEDEELAGTEQLVDAGDAGWLYRQNAVTNFYDMYDEEGSDM